MKDTETILRIFAWSSLSIGLLLMIWIMVAHHKYHNSHKETLDLCMGKRRIFNLKPSLLMIIIGIVLFIIKS